MIGPLFLSGLVGMLVLFVWALRHRPAPTPPAPTPLALEADEALAA